MENRFLYYEPNPSIPLQRNVNSSLGWISDHLWIVDGNWNTTIFIQWLGRTTLHPT